MIKKMFIIIIKILLVLLPLIIIIFSFFYNKLYILNVNEKNYNDVMNCMNLDNIFFKNNSKLEKIEVSKPAFSETEEFKFFYSDNGIYYKYSSINDNSNIKSYIKNNSFDIVRFEIILLIFSCIIAVLQILIPIIKFIIKLIANIIK